MRFAVVLYGGVSLAIYINGVVQELFRLVRSTAPVFSDQNRASGEAYFPSGGPLAGVEPVRGSEVVYRKLGQLLPFPPDPAIEQEAAQTKGVLEPKLNDRIRTRFVVDILSGSSAGGINGIYLARALANGEQIDALRDLWVNEGDIGILLNDGKSYAGLPETVEFQSPPRSLLNGQRLYVKALNALRAMRADRSGGGARPGYADQVDLAVTTTDLQGLRMPIALEDEVVYEQRHRHVMRFVFATAHATGSDRNDFVDNDGMLAFAARATSSFPFAFEPVVLEDSLQVDPGFQQDFARWGKAFFREYDERGALFQKYAFADGGYLDNKPFTHATDALRRRRADLPVERKLVYIEPDPGGVPTVPSQDKLGPDPPAPKPDVIANAIAALTGLPRAEPIRDDIQAVYDRNDTIERLRRIMLQVERDFRRGRDPFAKMRELPADATDAEVDKAIGACAMFHRAYRQLRAEIVADDLTSLVARLGGIRDETDAYRAAALVVRIWVERRTSAGESTGKDAGENLNPFLAHFDLSYWLRRLAFMQDRINDLLRQEHRSEEMLELVRTFVNASDAVEQKAQSSLEDKPESLRALKQALGEVAVDLRKLGRELRRPSDDPKEPTSAQKAVRELGVDATGLAKILRTDETDRQARVRAQRQSAKAFVDAHAEELDALGKILEGQLVEAFRQAAKATDLAFAGGNGGPPPPVLNELLAGYYRRFDNFDAISLPLAHPDLGEVNPVDVLRISPQDAKLLVDDTAPGGPRKLAGAAVHHFGGFFEANWRRNDILWGRLDGAERIIYTLIADPDLRKSLCEEAHAAILREELLSENVTETDRAAAAQPSNGSTRDENVNPMTDLLAGALLRPDAPEEAFPQTIVEALRRGDPVDRAAMLAALRALPDNVLVKHFKAVFQVPGAPDPQRMLSVAGRATTITGKVMEATSEQRSLPARPWFWVTRVGRLAWGVAEVAMPRRARSYPGLLFRYWTQVAVILAVLLILFGTLGVEAAQKVGWILLFLAVGARVVVWIAEALLRPAAPPPVPTPPAEAAGPPAAPHVITIKRFKLGRRVTIAGYVLGAVAIGLVIGGIWNDGVQIAGWVVLAVAAGLLIAGAAIRGELPRPRSILARGLAILIVVVVVVAVVEVVFHGHDDLDKLMSYVPGDHDSGIEHYVRNVWNWFVENVWNRLWPW